MGMLMVLFEGDRGEPVLPEHTLGQLARLGIITVSVLRDDRMVGLVLDGWAFDPTRSGEAARAAVAGTETGVRVLHPLLQTAVSPPLTKEATDDQVSPA
jgi:hypothetical protein